VGAGSGPGLDTRRWLAGICWTSGTTRSGQDGPPVSP
jgi:hypothetical protein